MAQRKPRENRCTTDSCHHAPVSALHLDGEPYGGVQLCTRCLGEFASVTLDLIRRLGAGQASFVPLRPGTVQASLALAVTAGR